MIEPSILVIYHGGCIDGTGAAWAFHCGQKLHPSDRKISYHPGIYNRPFPAIHDQTIVYILDFSYDRETIKAMCQIAEMVIVVDHHETAYKRLRGLDSECSNLRLIFDMKRSGAVMAWDLFVGAGLPLLLEHVQDHDLWRFEIPNTKDVFAALASFTKYDNLQESFAMWDQIYEDDELGIKVLLGDGKAINRSRAVQMESIIKIATRLMVIDGHTVPVCNAPYSMASDIGHALSHAQPFAATYYDGPDGRKFSLRSRKDFGVNVALIAEKFGGGGHPNAAGFTVPYDVALMFEIEPIEEEE